MFVEGGGETVVVHIDYSAKQKKIASFRSYDVELMNGQMLTALLNNDNQEKTQN